MTGTSATKLSGSGNYRQFSDSIWRPLVQYPARSSVLFFFFISLLVGAFLSARFFESNPIVDCSVDQALAAAQKIGNSHTIPNNKTIEIAKTVGNYTETDGKYTHPGNKTIQIIPFDDKTPQITRKAHKKVEVPLSCSAGNIPQTCPTNYPKTSELDPDAPPSPTCPEYFRWIYEDLQPWSKTGITKEMVESGIRTANFKLVILDGKAYVERYKKSWQTRDVFTLWGILQLLRKYPGRVPDLELMFDCVDWPVLQKSYFRGPNKAAPPPLFRYCGDDNTLDIVFPDWSFWGWAEINVKPWEFLSKELKEGNKKMKWIDRDPNAYWKGNPFVAPTRMDLLNCNVTDKHDWHARVYIQDWFKEAHQGFKQSDLASQCIYRYKIYIEGSAWSVSEKYILACDSVSLLINPRYYDFYSRSLMPIQHYWPVREDDKCRSIKFAVEWGDSHKQKAQAIAKAASDFIFDDLKMDYVYDYMLHLLTEYSKLLKFKPTLSANATELCSETMVCSAEGNERKFMMDSLVKGPSDTAPCAMPPPYERADFQALLRRKTNAIRTVEKWEKDYWANQTRNQ